MGYKKCDQITHIYYGDGWIVGKGKNMLGETIYDACFPRLGSQIVTILDNGLIKHKNKKLTVGEDSIDDEMQLTNQKEIDRPTQENENIIADILDFLPAAKNENAYTSGAFEANEQTTKNQTNDKQSDTVNHPSHYNVGNIEVIDYIEDLGLGIGFNLGNAIKYLSRAGHKDGNSAAQDVKKALWYIQRQYDAWTNDEAGIAEPPNTRKIGCYEYINDQKASFGIGRVLEAIDDAIYCKTVEDATKCLHLAIAILNSWLVEHDAA